MEWALGTLCLAWTLRETACLLASARRQAQFAAWASWEPTAPRTGAAIDALASPQSRDRA